MGTLPSLWVVSAGLLIGVVYASWERGLTPAQITKLLLCGTVFVVSLGLYIAYRNSTGRAPVPWNEFFDRVPFFFFMGYTAGGGLLYRRQILPRASENSVLFLTLGLLYVFWVKGWLLSPWVLPWLAPFTVLTLASALSHWQLSRGLRSALMLWSLVASGVLATFQMWSFMQELAETPEHLSGADALWTVIEMALMGSSILLFSSFLLIFLLFSDPGRSRRGDRSRRFGTKLLPELSQKVSPEQLSPLWAAAIVLTGGGLLAANGVLHWVQPSLALSFTLVLGPLLVEALQAL